MYAVGKREFLSLFKGVKAVIIIAILLLSSYYGAKYANILINAAELTKNEADDAHTLGLLLIVILFGLLFVMSLSHDTINRETHERTMRFLVTRTSRDRIILGKSLGILAFWLSCVSVAFLLTTIYSKKIDFFIFLQTMSLLTYLIAFTVLLSVLIPKPGYTMFLGIIFGLIFPALQFWFYLTSNIWISWMKYITPFYYLFRDDFTVLILIPLASLMILFALILFRRREC